MVDVGGLRLLATYGLGLGDVVMVTVILYIRAKSRYPVYDYF